MLVRGVGQDHPFVDGNKRTAFELADLFLEKNGSGVVASEEAMDESDRGADEEGGLTDEEVELFRASYERNRGAMERLAEL